MPRRLMVTNSRRISSVSPLEERASTTSPRTSTPRSPCMASAGCRKSAGVPVELRVAAILRPMMPLLPMPVTTTRPLQACSSASARSNAVAIGPRMRAASSGKASDSMRTTFSPICDFFSAGFIQKEDVNRRFKESAVLPGYLPSNSSEPQPPSCHLFVSFAPFVVKDLLFRPFPFLQECFQIFRAEGADGFKLSVTLAEQQCAVALHHGQGRHTFFQWHLEAFRQIVIILRLRPANINVQDHIIFFYQRLEVWTMENKIQYVTVH